MTEPRPQVVIELLSLAARHRCTGAELQAAVDVLIGRSHKGRPTSKIYAPLLWGMFALVGVYGRDRFTAAKQVIHLADGPVSQRESQTRALVRRFDAGFKDEELRATREHYTRSGPGPRVAEFLSSWKRSQLPWPQDVKSEIEMDTELRTLAMANSGSIDEEFYKAFEDYAIALDKSIAASSFESGRH
jgi:hypothetical protein